MEFIQWELDDLLSWTAAELIAKTKLIIQGDRKKRGLRKDVSLLKSYKETHTYKVEGQLSKFILFVQ